MENQSTPTCPGRGWPGVSNTCDIYDIHYLVSPLRSLFSVAVFDVLGGSSLAKTYFETKKLRWPEKLEPAPLLGVERCTFDQVIPHCLQLLHVPLMYPSGLVGEECLVSIC